MKKLRKSFREKLAQRGGPAGYIRQARLERRQERTPERRWERVEKQESEAQLRAKEIEARRHLRGTKPGYRMARGIGRGYIQAGRGIGKFIGAASAQRSRERIERIRHPPRYGRGRYYQPRGYYQPPPRRNVVEDLLGFGDMGLGSQRPVSQGRDVVVRSYRRRRVGYYPYEEEPVGRRDFFEGLL